MFSSRPSPSPVSTGASTSIALRVLFGAAFLLHLNPTLAQDRDKAEPYGFSGSLGMGVISMPTYEGSPNRRTVIGPDIELRYRTRNWGSVELGQRGLVWQAVETGDLRLGLTLGLDPGRKTQVPSRTNPTPGDKRLAGMGDLRSSPEVGVLLGYGPFSLFAHKSVGDQNHKGTQVDVNAEFPMALTSTVGLRFGAGLTWADARYMQAHFGVTPGQAQTTGFQAYTPKAGIRKFDVSAGAEYAVAKNWKLQGAVVLSRLNGAAQKSPLVTRKLSVTTSVGVAYAF